MGKIKEFCKKHKDEITIVLTWSASIGTAIGLGWCLRQATLDKRTRIIYCDVVRNTLDHAHQVHGKCTVFGGDVAGGLKPRELGKLGEEFMKIDSGRDDRTFTHFLAFCKDD